MFVLSMIMVVCAVGASNGAPRDLRFYPSGFEASAQQAWGLFKAKHGKSYRSPAEEYRRMNIFREKLRKIESHNHLYEMGIKSYKMGVNQFTDMELSEVVQYRGLKHSKYNSTNNHSTHLPLIAVNIPTAVDWRERGYVTPVKNQRGCGSCWAFSTTGAVEGQNFRKTGKLVSLSEQNLIDCSTKQGNEGCDGGLMDNAFQYIKDNHGIDTEDSYPYETQDGECRYKPETRGATITGYVDISAGSETLLTNALATIGPISVAIDARESLMSYEEGIYEEAACSSSHLNHGVLVVGYGSENGKDFYIVKNSWGANWGESGYVRIARNKENMCGISSMASYPLV